MLLHAAALPGEGAANYNPCRFLRAKIKGSAGEPFGCYLKGLRAGALLQASAPFFMLADEYYDLLLINKRKPT
jgi:hypothetical protein